MKKILLSLGLSLLLLSSLYSATALPDRTHIDSAEWVYATTAGNYDYYYAPSLTILSPQGRLETWLKIVKKNDDGKVAEMFAEHNFVTPDFDKYKNVELLSYGSEGHLRQDFGYSPDREWGRMPTGTPFEDTLQLALQYAKNN